MAKILSIGNNIKRYLSFKLKLNKFVSFNHMK
jgi:hypothetical protein